VWEFSLNCSKVEFNLRVMVMKRRIFKTFFVLLLCVIAYFVGQYSCSRKKKLCKHHFYQSCPNYPKDESRILEDKISKPILRLKLHNFGSMPLKTIPMMEEVLSELYKIEYSDDNYDVVLDGVDSKKPLPDSKAIKIFYSWEPVTPDISKYDLAIGFDYIKSPNYMRLPLYYVFYRNQVDMSFDRGKCEPQNKKNFASFLITNYGYSDSLKGCKARNRLFHKLSLYKNVVSGGKALNNTGKIVPFNETFAWIADSKFMISYENTDHDGYMTEKPFQAYIGGAIPIWWGDKKALEGINPKSIIYASDFETEESLVEYIKEIDSDDELYCKIWNEKIINDPSKNYSAVKSELKKRLKALIDKKLLK
jgi:hypothetical protein